MGSLLGVGTLEIMKSAVGLLFVDVAPGILAEGKEGVTSENFPRASAPLALTIHPGTALPATSRKADEWRPHHHRQPRLASLCATLTSSTPRPRPPPAARPASETLQIIVLGQREQGAKVRECDKKEGHQARAHTSRWPVSVLSQEPLGA